MKNLASMIRTLTAGTFVFGVITACSSGGSGGAGDSSSFASQYCQYVARCCGEKGYPADGATCRNFVNQGGSGRSFDQTAADACLADLQAASEKPDFCESGESTGGPSCNGVFGSAGSVQPGGACTDDSDCAASAEGEVDCTHQSNGSGAETRICQVRVRGKEGDSPCVGTREGNVTSYSYSGNQPETPPSRGFICYVEDKLQCDSQTGKCTRIQDVGGSCAGGGSHACVESAYCDYTQQKCVPRIAAGGDCSTSPAGCAEGLYCDSSNRICTKTLAVGSPCDRSDKCESHSCVNGKCEESNGLGDLGYILLCGPKSGG